MQNHPDTIIHSSWFDKNKYIKHIPQPSCIIVDNIYYLSDSLPNIFIYVEPKTIYDISNYLIENYNKYHTIFTYDEDVLKKCPNARKYIYGTSWIKNTYNGTVWVENDYCNDINISKKEFKISNLAGTKLINNSEGHKFRQVIHHNQEKLKAYPITFFRSYNQHPHIKDYGNNPFLISDKGSHNKELLFDTFQFAIIIENSKQVNYFTEKIVDCLITKTIPIYWGCPNISDFFDTTGWIILDTIDIDKLYQKLKILNNKYYNEYFNFIEKNYELAKQYADLYNNINNSIHVFKE
jgi:hypothetical protein